MYEPFILCLVLYYFLYCMKYKTIMQTQIAYLTHLATNWITSFFTTLFLFLFYVKFHSQQQSSLHVALSLFSSTNWWTISECLINYALCRRFIYIMGINSEEIMHFTYVQFEAITPCIRFTIRCTSKRNGDWFIKHVIILYLQPFIIVLMCCSINVITIPSTFPNTNKCYIKD